MRILLLGSLLLLSGCAFTVHDVQVNYQYSGQVNQELEGQTLTVGAFTDSRSIADPRMLANQQNGYGRTTSGGWQAERPVAEIARDALVQGLIASGAHVDGGGSDLHLTGDIMSYEFGSVMGVASVGITGRLTVRLQLMDQTTGQIIWRDSFQGSAQSTHFVAGRDDVVQIFVSCLDEVVQIITTDAYFRQQIRTSGIHTE